MAQELDRDFRHDQDLVPQIEQLAEQVKTEEAKPSPQADRIESDAQINAVAPVQADADDRAPPGKPAKKTRNDELAELINVAAAHDDHKDDAGTAKPTVVEQFPLPGTDTPQHRHDAAADRLKLIKESILAEDATRSNAKVDKDDTKGHERVQHQIEQRFPNVEGLADACQKISATAVKGKDAAHAQAKVTEFEGTVRAFQDAYLSTYLMSTDGAAPAKPKGILLGPGAKKQIKDWGTTPVKFAVPAAKPDEVRVGANMSHVDVAGGNALSAGWLQFNGNKVSKIENVSGGFRPGPLRNAIVLERLQELGFVEDDLDGTAVNHQRDGTYDGAELGG